MINATIAEIRCGIALINVPGVAQRVQTWLDGTIRYGQPRIADFDALAGGLLGSMWATPTLNNLIANDPPSKKVEYGGDLAITATSIAREMVVVTGNVDDFLTIHAAFPLPGLYNPFDKYWAVELADGGPTPGCVDP
jgi:toxin FitB